MFLRKKSKSAAGENYEYWNLCETVRTAKGPRQRIVATLGKLDEREVRSGGWENVEALLAGRKPDKAQQMEFGERGKSDESVPAARWEKVDVGAVGVERVREFGEVYLALALWNRLGLGKLLGELIEPGREKVDWPTVASVLVAARFCGQRSELGIAEGWYEKTALEDLIGVEEKLINDDRLYRGLAALGGQKEKLCAHLIERYRDWFGVRMEFLLYDVTSTYFEGDASRNPKAARGYSRDKRSDCEQVCIGLVCTPEGLPLSYEVFAGNRTDVTTVEEIVKMMEEKYGAAERVWVMDRGMVSEANIDFLRSRKALYIVGTPKSELRHFEAALLEDENWSLVQDGLEARLVEHPDGNGTEKYVLCRSTARAEKERAMLVRQSEGLTAALAKIDAWLWRNPGSSKPRFARTRRAVPAGCRFTAGSNKARAPTPAGEHTCFGPIASKPIRRFFGGGIPSSLPPRRPFGQPRATWACARSIITPNPKLKHTSWFAFWPSPSGDHWSSGWRPRGWAPALVNSSTRYPLSKAWMSFFPWSAPAPAPNCACESWQSPKKRLHSFWPILAFKSRAAQKSLKM